MNSGVNKSTISPSLPTPSVNPRNCPIGSNMIWPDRTKYRSTGPPSIRASTRVAEPSRVKLRACSGSCTSQSRWPVASCVSDSTRKPFPTMLPCERNSCGRLGGSARSKMNCSPPMHFSRDRASRCTFFEADPRNPTRRGVAFKMPMDNPSMAVAIPACSR